MCERNYLVVEIHTNGTTRVVAQVSALDRAQMLLGELESTGCDPHNRFAIIPYRKH